MPSDEEIDNYLLKSGDTEIGNGTLEENENGFCVWKTNGDALLLVNVYGNGSFWNKWAEIKAKSLNMKRIVFATKRKPVAFIKKHGFEISGYIMARPV